MKHHNTLHKGSVRYIVFKEADIWYAVGLEFNIVESGTTAREALILLFEALEGYIESARKLKARPNILNQKTDSEYEKMWSNRKNKPTKNLITFGELNLNKSLQIA